MAPVMPAIHVAALLLAVLDSVSLPADIDYSLNSELSYFEITVAFDLIKVNSLVVIFLIINIIVMYFL